jgi:hypothetical protein
MLNKKKCVPPLASFGAYRKYRALFLVTPHYNFGSCLHNLAKQDAWADATAVAHQKQIKCFADFDVVK